MQIDLCSKEKAPYLVDPSSAVDRKNEEEKFFLNMMDILDL